MAQRNSYRNNQSSDFDLDSYIDEQANQKTDSGDYQHSPKPSNSNWFRNMLFLGGFGILSLLYFNNWNPMQVYGNIFGIDKYQTDYTVPVPQPPEPSVIDATIGNGVQVVDLRELERLSELEGLEALEGLEGLEGLEALEDIGISMTELENTAEMNELREFALRTAMEALEGIGNSPEFGEAIGEASQLGIQEALRELQNLRASERGDAERLAEEARQINVSFQEYSEEITKLGLNEKLSNETVQQFHEANVPSSFLEQLDKLGLIDKITTDGIIQAYQEGN